MAAAGLDFGVAMFPADYAIDPVALGRLVEERGFESLWFPEHTHIPASRESAWPGGDELPQEYWHTHDPFVALGAVAAATERLKLGTGICLVVERDPITTAKEVASLDRLAGGNGEKVLDRVLAFGDEWMPNRVQDEALMERLADLRRRAEEAGRAPVP